jgi:sugar (pentulose or hexulose) kinase
MPDPDTVLLVDFGASRIKAVLWSLIQSRILGTRECPSPVLQRGQQGEAVGDPEQYWQALEATAGLLAELDDSVQDLWICAEMHGFMLADPVSAKPVTPYISWQDQRACYRAGKGLSKLEELQQSIAPLLYSEGGMRLRPGLPIANLACMGHELADSSQFLTLVDWLLLRGGESAPCCHVTMAAGTGLYSLADKNWSDILMGQAGITSLNLRMPPVNHDVSSPIGKITLKRRSLRVWGGLGDLQAAAHGMGFPNKAPVLVNLGTGSQVMVAAQSPISDVELRICAEGQLAHAITHIPSGRALNTFASLIDDCAHIGGGLPFFWRVFSSLNAQQVLDADSCVDLNTFSSSWRYEDGGKISRITEGKFTSVSFISALAKSWLTQYAQALGTMAKSTSGAHFLLGGGLSRRAAFIPLVLESMLASKSIEVPLRTGEETLDGLLSLAEATY